MKMLQFKVVLVCTLLVVFVSGKNIDFDVDVVHKNGDGQSLQSARTARRRVTSLRDALQCGFDVNCFLDTIEVVVRDRKELILAEADLQYMRSKKSRSVSNESPSVLAESIQGMVSKMVDIIKDTVMVWFQEDRSVNEVEENNVSEQHNEENEEEDDQNDDDEEDDVHSENAEEARAKKKKKLRNLMKLLVLGAVIKAKITLLLQLLSAALQIKFFFIALAGLLINKIRLWYDLKKGHHPQKVIYYEHAQHQHHYDHIEDEHGGLWGRAYNVEDGKEMNGAQEIAYRRQKPIPVA